MKSVNSYNDLTLISRFIENKEMFEKHKQRLNNIYRELNTKTQGEFGIIRNEKIGLEREKYLSFNRKFEDNERGMKISKQNKMIFENLVKITTRDNEIKKQAENYKSQGPQLILRKEKYAKLKNDRIQKDNNDLEKRILNVYHPFIDYKKWDREYNKSIDFQKFSKKFELPGLEKKGKVIIKREFDEKMYTRTDKGHRRILSQNKLIDEESGKSLLLERSEKSAKKDPLVSTSSKMLFSSASTGGLSDQQKTTTRFFTNNKSPNGFNSVQNAMSKTYYKDFPKIYLNDPNDIKKKTFYKVNLKKNKTINEVGTSVEQRENEIKEESIKEVKLAEISKSEDKNFEKIIKNIRNDVGQYLNNMEMDNEEQGKVQEGQNQLEPVDAGDAYEEPKET